MTERLNSQSLIDVANGTGLPDYDRGSITPGVVHLGIGAFHRAHQAAYLDQLLTSHPDWGIVGASLRRPDTKDALEPQDGLYTLAVRDASGTKCQIIGSVLDVIDANEERQRLIDLMASEPIRIVSLTVTEKGYCHDPATGELDESHKDITHDLAHPEEPVSAPGLIVEALRRRKEAGLAPFTVMSCDNLPANGPTCARIVVRFAELRDAELGAYVKAGVAFPGTMVDRIVPATTDADRAEISSLIGVEDAWPIVTEPFTQWVIEDRFPAGRPPFEKVGAELVENVEPFEHMKLRMLNGSHSSIAYLGYLSGYETVSDTITDPAFAAYIHKLMTEEIMPTLNMPGTDLDAYRDALLERFANPALKHRTWQIAMDGSQKLPQRLLNTIRDRIASSEPYERLALGVAAWMRYAAGTDEKGEPIDVRDPLSQKFLTIDAGADNDAELLVGGFLALDSVFGDLAANADFGAKITEQLSGLMDKGAKAMVTELSGN